MRAAVSVRDLLLLSAPAQGHVLALLWPHLMPMPVPDPVTTQGGERVLPLRGDAGCLRTVIYRAQVLAPAGARLRFYVTSVSGWWDLVPTVEVVARMQAQEHVPR